MRLYWKNILFDYHFFVLYQNIEWGEMISGRVFIVRIFEQKPRNNCTYIKIKIIKEKTIEQLVVSVSTESALNVRSNNTTHYRQTLKQ